jgi:hypothetical protein
VTHPHPYYISTDLEEVTSRSESARRIIAGFAAQMPALAGIWGYLDTALSDAAVLCSEVARLSAELTATRLDRANLLAAMRAALAANAEGEPGFLLYIRDELNARQAPGQRHERPS